MQQRCEPYTLALSRRLAHGDEPVRRGVPAQCPDRGRPAAVPLGRGPSLPGLRGGNALVVRPLHRYYSLVRLLIRVHAHRSAFAFMSRSGVPCRSRMRPPRFRAKNFSTCARSPTARGSPLQANTRWEMLPSLQQNAIGTSELDPFRSSILGPWSPLGTLHVGPRGTPRITRGWDGWLDLSHGGLSPPILCQLPWRTRLGVIRRQCAG